MTYDFSRTSNQQLRELIAETWDGTIPHVDRKIAAQRELGARTAWLRG